MSETKKTDEAKTDAAPVAVDDREVLLKVEGANPTGSFKARGLCVALAAHGRVAQLARHGGPEPRQIAFGDVVLRPNFHGRHGDVFADGPGHKDERQLRRLLADDREGFLAAEGRHRVVGNGHVPLRRLELAAEVHRVVDPSGEDVEAGSCEGSRDYSGIKFRVFDLQKPQGRRRHQGCRFARNLRGAQSRKATVTLTARNVPYSRPLERAVFRPIFEQCRGYPQ